MASATTYSNTKKDDGANSQVDRLSGGHPALPRPPERYSSSSPKKNRCAQRWLQKTRPYSRRPQSRQTHLKQIGHFCRLASSSLFWQLTQIVATDAGESIALGLRASRFRSMLSNPGGVPASRAPVAV